MKHCPQKQIAPALVTKKKSRKAYPTSKFGAKCSNNDNNMIVVLIHVPSNHKPAKKPKSINQRSGKKIQIWESVGESTTVEVEPVMEYNELNDWTEKRKK